MTKSTRRFRKKIPRKPSAMKELSDSSSHVLDCGSPNEMPLPLFTATASREDSEEWTPVQLEQIDLANKLNEYINSFQKKLIGLSFTPSDRELVILFIMYLHPRWRRFVEPMELSCSTWIEAAAYAKLHCGRISAMLGCEKIGSSCIFNTPESRALRDSGYFAPETPLTDDLSSSNQSESTPDKADKLVNNININPDDLEDSKSDSAASMSAISSTSTTTNVKQHSNDLENGQKEDLKVEKPDSMIEESIVNESIEDKHNHKLEDTNSIEERQNGGEECGELENGQINGYLEQQSDISKEIKPHQTVKNKKTYKANTVYAKQHIDATNLIVNLIPSDYDNIHFMFIEIPIKEMEVKTILAKFSFESSVISIDCVRRLGLEWNENGSKIKTNLGSVEALGDLALPFAHPENPEKMELEVKAFVLPKIFGGIADLVLGADFFFKYQPVLNVKTRTIHFFGKEAPYTVKRLGS